MDKPELTATLSRIKSLGSVFMAYNCNIDNIVKVRQLEKFAKPPELKELKSPDDLFASIAYTIANEESAELTMDLELEEWLAKHIRPEKQRMGGQIGIMANQLASFGAKPVVYTPLLYKELCKKFEKNVLLLDDTLKKPDEITRKDGRKINWIFEFEKGQKFGKITAKSANRFIAASRPDDFRLGAFELDFDFSCAILSGFHAFKEKYADGTTQKEQFILAQSLVDRINEREKPLHIEIAYTKSEKIMRNLVRLASKADSIGLDESELMLILKVLGQGQLAEKIHRKHDVRDVLAGMEKLHKKMKTGKIHLHGFGYYMAICSDDYPAKPEVIKKSMEFASIVASAAASGTSLVAGLKNQTSIVGDQKKELLGKALKREDVVFTSASLSKRITDVVGLGDIISASIFVSEVAHQNQ